MRVVASLFRDVPFKLNGDPLLLRHIPPPFNLAAIPDVYVLHLSENS